jgi:hypothetical protein
MRIACISVTVACLCLALPARSAELVGDLVGTGQAELASAVRILRVVAGIDAQPSAQDLWRWDCNKSGVVDSGDAAMILRCVVGLDTWPIPGGPTPSGAIIINHLCTNLNSIPTAWISSAKQTLHIAYGHTSHGSQLTTGMTGLADWKGDLYRWETGGSPTRLDIRDADFPGEAYDLGNPDRTAWAASTRTYLNSGATCNVVIWSWCGEVSEASKEDIDTYLSLMSALERDFPKVRFVYMTGHLDGSGLEGNLHVRNQQIRDYCIANKKVLYDFEDIESYNPDGAYFGARYPNDACDYDSDGDGYQDRNWARDWQDAHTVNVDWYQCEAAHTEPLNANRKAYAAWWLWARLAGWSG